MSIKGAIARWSERRHGRDALPMTIERRRIYIVPTRFGIALALLLVTMLIAGLNYNSNLGLAFAFLMSSLALVAMHHCHRNLLGLKLDAATEADAFAGGTAQFAFLLDNGARLARGVIEIHCDGAQATVSVAPGGREAATVSVPVPRRGVYTVGRTEVRTRHPFGWFRAWTYVQAPLTAYVAPAPAGERLEPPAATSAVGSATSTVQGEDEFSGLRSYAAGMPLKHMAWKALARGGEPAVRSYTGLAASPEWLDWSTLGSLDDEARLAQLCLWVLDSEAARRPYGLRLPGIEIAPAAGMSHRLASLRALARHPNAP